MTKPGGPERPTLESCTLRDLVGRFKAPVHALRQAPHAASHAVSGGAGRLGVVATAAEGLPISTVPSRLSKSIGN